MRRDPALSPDREARPDRPESVAPTPERDDDQPYGRVAEDRRDAKRRATGDDARRMRDQLFPKGDRE
jgi:hypothetical protein